MRRGGGGYLASGTLALLALLAASSCRRVDPAGHYSQLRAEVDSMLVVDRLEDLESRLRAAAARPAGRASPEWLREWARIRAESVQRMRALRPEQRAELAGSARPVPAAVGENPAEWAELRSAMRRQLETRRRILGPDSPDVAETLSALARLERRHGSVTRAIEYDLEALAIRRRRFGPSSPEVANTHWMLGRDYRLSGTIASAPLHLDSALVLIGRSEGVESLAYADVLMDRANHERLVGTVERALEMFDRALAIRRRRLGTRAIPVAETLTDIAVTAMRRQDWATVERLTAEAVAIRDARGSAPSEAYALSLSMHGQSLRHLGRLREAKSELERTISMQERLRREAPRDDTIRRRFHVLSGWGDLAAAQLLGGDSLAAFESLERGLSRGWLERALARGEVDTSGCWNHLLERAQARLSDSTALVGWLDPIFNPGSPGNPFWGFVVRRTGGVRWFTIETSLDSRHSFRTRAFDLVGKLDAAASWPFQVPRWDDLDRALHDLWSMRFAAMDSTLDGVRELIVVSPHINYLCPIEMMRDDRGRYLGDRFAISYAPSILHFLAAPPPDREARIRGRWSGVILRTPGIDPIGEETTALATWLRHPRVLAGPAASEQALDELRRRGELAGLDLLHIAAHGRDDQTLFQSARPERIRIELSEADSGRTIGSDRDGHLTLAELESWNLGARLITLATCRGSGWSSLSQGTRGIGQSLLNAGARSVVMSVMPVEDDAASRFMRYFYEALFARTATPCSIAEALRQARVRMRSHVDIDGRHPYAHPMYWGSFVLVGDAG